MIVGRLLAIALLLLGVATPAPAQQNRFALIVQGASGDPEYATLHRGWVDAMVKLLRDQFKMDPRALIVLTEKPGAGEERSSAEAVRAAFARLAKESKPNDLVFVMLIGHGSGDAVSAKFNLIGPDLTTEEWAAIVKPVPARIAFVNSTSASFPFLAGLSGVNRVVITATNSVAQRYHTHFPGAFIQSLAASDADTDKNGRISLLEAFTHASRLVTQQFEQNFRESTEKALLDDNGDGKGRLAGTAGPDGEVAAFTYLDTAAAPVSSDPEVQKLLVRQQQLTEEIDDLRRRRAVMPAAEFEREFERLIIDLSVVSRDVRRRRK
jgi:hypothetical protein